MVVFELEKYFNLKYAAWLAYLLSDSITFADVGTWSIIMIGYFYRDDENLLEKFDMRWNTWKKKAKK